MTTKTLEYLKAKKSRPFAEEAGAREQVYANLGQRMSLTTLDELLKRFIQIEIGISLKEGLLERLRHETN